MASTAQEIVELLDPSKVGDSRLAGMLAYADECLDEATWSTDYQKAIAYLTLHLYAMGAYGSSAREDTWAQTSWGQMLLDLQLKRTGAFTNRMML